ncbi:MAG: hypothetical protein JKY34_04890 [Kordiimonadaceae bacterium]|nr:hypothetical protein [Kordiimonadaceae bacterium]
MKSLIAVAIITLPVWLLAFNPEPLNAQESQEHQLNLLRQMSDIRRKMTLSRTLKLSNEKSTGFWAVYEDYEQERIALDDQFWKTLLVYVDAYRNSTGLPGTLTDQQAKELLDQFFTNQSARLALKIEYRKKFAQAISIKKLVLLFQVENKLETQEMARISQQVPLIK